MSSANGFDLKFDQIRMME